MAVDVLAEVLEERSSRFGRGREDIWGEAGSFLTLMTGGALAPALQDILH